MQDRACIGQLPHENARTAGVIQMHVCQKHEVDRCAVDAEFLERREQIRHRMCRAGIDKGGTAVLLNDMRGRHPEAYVLGIHRGDAICESRKMRLQDSSPALRQRPPSRWHNKESFIVERPSHCASAA
jgi:hypothetical protein